MTSVELLSNGLLNQFTTLNSLEIMLVDLVSKQSVLTFHSEGDSHDKAEISMMVNSFLSNLDECPLILFNFSCGK